MAIALKQAIAVGTYVMKQRLQGKKRYPLVLMLEPLFRCNLACNGCGKIQHPVEILRANLSAEKCLAAVEECGAPVVAIPGGEPLLHPEIKQIVDGLVARKKFVYLCTNALRLEQSLDKFTPSDYFGFNVHLDGPKAIHDEAVARPGTYDIAIKAIRAAKAKGFRVYTNTTIFDGSTAEDFHGFFDFLHDELKVDGMQISPGYRYEKAPDQDHFLAVEETRQLFRNILAPYKAGKKKWEFNASPFFLDFLTGEKEYDCTPWGMPSYSMFGWQKPCYLLGEGYAKTYQELLDTTEWEKYGHKSGNPKCEDCMVHSGFEATAAADMMRPQNLIGSIKTVSRSSAMLVRSPSFELFEEYLESVLDGAAANNANGPLIREHFGLDDPTAKRGKRLRPRILLTVAECEGADGSVALGAAAALELLHNFSLIHDDIEDGDEMRHGRATLWAQHGVRAALVAGDAMSALAYLTLVDGSRTVPATTLASMLECLQHAHFRMCEGQAFDIGFETATFVTFDEYVRMIEGKTAALLAVACELGAWAAGASDERAQAYSSVGRAYGLAFQVRDDVLGTWGRTEETGKPSGADIRRRKWSFPVAWALAQPPSADRSIVADAYAHIGSLGEAHAKRVIGALERLGARDAADAACERYIEEAIAISSQHGVDRDGRLGSLFNSTAKRTV